MTRKVTITLNLNLSKYHDIEDSPDGAIELAIAMLENEADFPDDPDSVVIECENVMKIQGHHF